uniref:Uncharacterized protein n=1 Tax=Callithrix jacchus TaxID=9483 RepID=A0A8I3W728_CALJA
PSLPESVSAARYKTLRSAELRLQDHYQQLIPAQKGSLCNPCIVFQACIANHLPGTSNSCTSASQVAGITGMATTPSQFFLFLVETGFCPVGQAGLKLLASTDLPASASQSARITGVSHHVQPHVTYLKINF